MGRRATDEIEKHRDDYQRDGYVVFRNVVSKDKLAELTRTLSEEFERAKSSALFSGGGTISGHLNCFPGESTRFIYEELERYGIVDLVKEFSPKSASHFNVGCNFNMPGSVAQHYHADGLFLEDFVVVNTAVVDTDLGNGAIDLLPGTHKRFYKYWEFAVQRLGRLTTRIPMQRGDVLMRSSVLWHRGMPNYTSTPRPMVALTFGEKHHNAVDGDPFRHNDGKIMFQPNWYTPSALGRLRERTFVAAPITYDAWRFARSLYGNKGYASF